MKKIKKSNKKAAILQLDKLEAERIQTRECQVYYHLEKCGWKRCGS